MTTHRSDGSIPNTAPAWIACAAYGAAFALFALLVVWFVTTCARDARAAEKRSGSELLPAGTGPAPRPNEDQLAPRAASPGAAASLSWLVLSDATVEARAALTSGPATIRLRGSTGDRAGPFGGFGFVLDGRPVGSLQVRVGVDVWWCNPAWRGECRLDVGAIVEHERDHVRVYATLGTVPSAQLWESTSGGSSSSADFGWIVAGGIAGEMRRRVEQTDVHVRIAFRFEAGAHSDARAATWEVHCRGALTAAIELDAHGALVLGLEADAAGGPRATPLDWRTLAAVGRFVVGIELRFGVEIPKPDWRP